MALLSIENWSPDAAACVAPARPVSISAQIVERIVMGFSCCRATIVNEITPRKQDASNARNSSFRLVPQSGKAGSQLLFLVAMRDAAPIHGARIVVKVVRNFSAGCYFWIILARAFTVS
jgi:hypothetical protein